MHAWGTDIIASYFSSKVLNLLFKVGPPSHFCCYLACIIGCWTFKFFFALKAVRGCQNSHIAKVNLSAGIVLTGYRVTFCTVSWTLSSSFPF